MLCSFGTHLSDSNHVLKHVDIEDMAHYIIEGHQGLIDYTQLLRKVKAYSVDRYRVMKKKLPYYCMSIFEPSHRKISNLEQAVGMIIDIDFNNEDITPYRDRIARDPRVLLLYTSPSGQGLKVTFKFETPIYQASSYSRLYKEFTHSFGVDYEILQFIDMQNSDASRVSFLSYDPYAVYNPDAIPISWTAVDRDEGKESQPDIAPDVYKEILNKLNTRPVIKKRGAKIKPGLEKLIPQIEITLGEYSIEVVDIQGIQSGMKVIVNLGDDMGEVNVYHGKRGFSVVSSPKRGTNDELNEACARLIRSILPHRYIL